MIKYSLILNIVVLIPVCFGLITDAEWEKSSFGLFSPARGILLSIYLSILIASLTSYFINSPWRSFHLLPNHNIGLNPSFETRKK
jgi:hypothetical protein